MISKELLSEVLNQNVTSVYKQQEQYRYTTSSINGPWTSGSDVPLPNIHELAHICKEWAIYKGWVLHEVRNLKEYIVYFSGDFREPSDDFRADTEPEAIFKACEWILKENRCLKTYSEQLQK